MKKIRASTGFEPMTSAIPLRCGAIPEHRTGIAEVMGSNRVEALIFFMPLLSNCLNWKIYCDDHTSLSSHTAVQMNYFIYISHDFTARVEMNSIN